MKLTSAAQAARFFPYCAGLKPCATQKQGRCATFIRQSETVP